jgi:hypothetical protein
MLFPCLNILENATRVQLSKTLYLLGIRHATTILFFFDEYLSYDEEMRQDCKIRQWSSFPGSVSNEAFSTRRELPKPWDTREWQRNNSPLAICANPEYLDLRNWNFDKGRLNLLCYLLCLSLHVKFPSSSDGRNCTKPLKFLHQYSLFHRCSFKHTQSGLLANSIVHCCSK